MKLKQKTISAVLAVTMAGTLISGLPLSGQGLAGKLGIVNMAYAAEDSFYNERFVERMRKLHAALHMGDESEVQAVRNLRDEIKTLNFRQQGNLLNPVWNQLRGKVDESTKEVLFNFIVEVGGLQYDADFANLEAIRTNPLYHSAIQSIATAGGESDLTIEHIMDFVFGNESGTKLGLEGTIQNLVSQKNTGQLIKLISSEAEQNALLREALRRVLSDTNNYELSVILANLGVTEQNLMDTLNNFRVHLRNDVPAQNAMMMAYLRSEIQEKVDISENGRKHRYTLEVFGIEIPNALLRWSKVDGSPHVHVAGNGLVTIPGNVSTATATIQASILNKVIFSKEVTLTTEDASDEFLKDFKDAIADIMARLQGASEAEKVMLIQQATVLAQQTWSSLTVVDAEEMVRVIAGNAIFRPETSDIIENVEDLVRGEDIIREHLIQLEEASGIDINDRFLARSFGFDLNSVEQDRLDIIIPKAILDAVKEAEILDISFLVHGMRMVAPIGQFNGDLLLSIQRPDFSPMSRSLTPFSASPEVFEIGVQVDGQPVTDLEQPIKIEVPSDSSDNTRIEFQGGADEDNLIIERE